MKKVLIIIICISILFLLTISSYSADISFDTGTFTEDKIDDIIETTNLKCIDKEPFKSDFVCFDINENGWLAIGRRGMLPMKYKVIIYDSECKFQYGFSFTIDGEIDISWSDNNISIYDNASNIVETYTSSGECIDSYFIEETTENNNLWKETLSSNKKVVGEYEYVASNIIPLGGLFSSSQILKVSENGDSKIIYNANLMTVIKTLIYVILSCAVGGIIAYKYVKTKKIQH